MITITRSRLGDTMKVDLASRAYATDYELEVLRVALHTYAYVLPATTRGVTYTGQEWLAAIRQHYDCVSCLRNAEVARVLARFTSDTPTEIVQ